MLNAGKTLRILTISILIICILLLLFISGSAGSLHSEPAYKNKLFDKSYVHTVDIYLDDKDAFFDTAADEKYSSCTVVIDGEEFRNVGIRAKGNNSLRLTEKYGSIRYSLKLEFDKYLNKTYHGLDKFSLDSSFQDNSYLKTLITFDMMNFMGVPTPLVSYTFVTVNGEDHGLFLAVEEPEESFLRRVYGNDHGKLYKPDYKNLKDANNDVALKYTDDNFESYDNIFRNSKVSINSSDKTRLINSLKTLSTGENLDTVLNLEEIIRYFTVQTFVVNLDSYLGKTGHNYFLYEDKGKLSILPWDYNLAFATYSLGMPRPINDSELYINYPINTPASGEVMLNRPLYHNVMQKNEYLALYHQYYDHLIKEYFESGYFESFVNAQSTMIAPYVEKDPTAFCSYEDHKTSVRTITDFCLLRAESVRLQLEGVIPATIKGQSEAGGKDNFVKGDGVWLPDMGEIADLKD